MASNLDAHTVHQGLWNKVDDGEHSRKSVPKWHTPVEEEPREYTPVPYIEREIQEQFDELIDHIKIEPNATVKTEHSKDNLDPNNTIVIKDTKVKSENSITYKCCSREFKDQQSYDNHMIFHQQRIRCEYCDKNLFTIDRLKRHIETTHTKRRCRYCSLVFWTKLTLKNHIEAYHPEYFIANRWQRNRYTQNRRIPYNHVQRENFLDDYYMQTSMPNNYYMHNQSSYGYMHSQHMQSNPVPRNYYMGSDSISSSNGYLPGRPTPNNNYLKWACPAMQNKSLQKKSNFGKVKSKRNNLRQEPKNIKIEPISKIKVEPSANIKIEPCANIKVEPALCNIKSEPLWSHVKVEPND